MDREPLGRVPGDPVICSSAKSDARRTLVLAIVNLGYACLLVALAVAPTLPMAVDWVPDKLAHAAAYAGEALLLYWALVSLVQPLTATAVAWLGTAALGLLTEILQGLQRARSADAGDLLADMVGATIVVFVATLVRRAIPAMRTAW